MKLKLFAAALLALVALGCGGVASPSSNRKDNFSLSVPPGGYSDIFPVSVGSGGSLEYSVFVSSVTPTPASNQIGVLFGQLASGQCIPWYGPTTGIIGHTVASGSIQPGAWCVQFFDPGIFYGGATFATNATVVGYVSHP